MKNIGTKVIGGLETGVGCTGAAYLSNKVIGAKIKEKYHGPLFLVLGLAADIFIEEPHLNNIGKGIAAYGFLRSTGDFILPEQKSDLGLSGIGASPNDVTDWDKLAKQVEEEEAAKKLAEEKGTQGIADHVINKGQHIAAPVDMNMVV